MKQLYNAPVLEFVGFRMNDVITSSGIIEADANATGYENGDLISNVFKLQ